MMADSKDETGRGASRPYATIDLEATEVGGKPTAANSATGKAAWSRQPLAATLAILGSWRYPSRSVSVLTPILAGLAGGLLALLAWYLFAGARDGEFRRQLHEFFATGAGRVSARDQHLVEPHQQYGSDSRQRAVQHRTGRIPGDRRIPQYTSRFLGRSIVECLVSRTDRELARRNRSLSR